MYADYLDLKETFDNESVVQLLKQFKTGNLENEKVISQIGYGRLI